MVDPGDQNLEPRPTPDSADPEQITLASLWGSVPDLTGGLSSEEYVRQIRDRNEPEPRARRTDPETAYGSLERERQRIIEHRWDKPGTVCGACAQLAKVYRRNVYGKPAMELVRMAARYECEPRYFTIDGRDCGKLKLWGLIEQEVGDDGKHVKKSWRPTLKGVAFARGRISIERYAYTYDNVPLEFSSDDRVKIRDVLPESFDYDSIWRTER